MVRNDPLWKGIIQELIFPFLTFFFPEEKMNLKFEKRVELLVTNQNIPMGVEEILLQQTEEKGIEMMNEAVRNMLKFLSYAKY